MESLNIKRAEVSRSLMNGLEDDGFDTDFDEDVNKADYELSRELGAERRVARADSQSRVRCLFHHQDVGADLSQVGGIGFDEAFDARIGNVLNELAGMLEDE